jgi:hypothetical protein
MSGNSSSDEANLVVFELSTAVKRESTKTQSDQRTLDILVELSNSSLSDIEKVLVCCPICTLSPGTGAKMSFVIARMFAQLSISTSVALDGACTTI